MGDIPWTTVIVVAIVLVILVVAIWLFVRWRRKRAAAPGAATQPSLAGQIADAWTRFYHRLPLRARHFPTVIVMGDAGVGKSHLINARVDWRSQANQFYPSAVEHPLLQLYLGSSVVVHELAAPLLRDIRDGTRRALARLWRHIGPSATVIVVVDARTVSTTPPATLRELGQLVRGKIRAFPSRCRDAVQVRVCLSHMDQIEGYEDFAAVVGAAHDPIDVGALTEPLVDASALAAAARQVMATYDPNLAYGLTHRKSDAFARLVGFYGAFPVLLTQLQPLLGALTGEDASQPQHRPSSLYTSSLVPESHVADPFVVDRGLVESSIVRQRRLHRRLSLAVGVAGVLAVGLLMWRHEVRVAAAEAAVDHYAALAMSTTAIPDSEVRRVLGEIDRMERGEWLWLSRAFVARKQELAMRLAQELRRKYILPELHQTEPINRSTMLYAVALLYTSEDNGLNALIRSEIPLWASKLDLSPAVVTAYVEASKLQYGVAEQFAPKYVGSDWPSFVFEQVKPVYEQTKRITQAQLDELQRHPPQLYDQREYVVRERIIELLERQLALATHPPITELLQSPLGSSAWVEQNATALRGISTAVARAKLALASPRTLDELGDEVERMLTGHEHGKEIYRVTRVHEGETESFELDAAVWNSKLALASASLTIAAVRDHNLAKPEDQISFFAPDTALGDVGVSSSLQGPTTPLPGIYTAAAFERQVAPALDFVTARAGKLGLGKDDMAALEAVYREQIEAYAERYATALRAYYTSFRFDPGGEQGLPYALSALVQPSSWFTRFLTTVSTNATPTLGDGPYYAVMAEALADFRPLAELLAPAKGVIPGLGPYQKIIIDLVAALEAAGEPPADDAGAAPATLASTLAPSGKVTLNKLTGVDKDRLDQVNGWLSGANIERSLHSPFLWPVESAYALGVADINRAIGQAWRSELAPVLSPLLSRFPFRPGAKDDVAIADLEAVVRSQGKQPGTFWSAFGRWLGPVTVQRGGSYQWIGGGVTGPAGALATINDLARLSRALWDADGNPQPLPIELTPQPLDATPVSGRVPTIAYLRSGASAIYAFNQRPGTSKLLLQWWAQGTSSIILELRKPGTKDAETFSIDEAESPFSFYRLLCRSRVPDTRRSPDVIRGCGPGRGRRVWDVPLDRVTTRPVTLTLDADPWALFVIGR